MIKAVRLAVFGVGLLVVARSAACGGEALASWREGKTKAAIVEFVKKVTEVGGKDFVPVEDRIATFDNDGTLWSEKPAYFQLEFAADRLRRRAAEHPEWRENPMIRGVLDGDYGVAMAGTVADRLGLVAAGNEGLTTDAFDRAVADWIVTARHPRFKRPYTDLVYQPMLELLAYLRANGFKTYIVSGGGAEFMRVWSDKVYGIPREQVIGSTIKVKYELRDGVPVLARQAEIEFIDDKAEKPVGIHRAIGKRPIAAFGNSDGDYEMLRWTTAGPGLRLALIVHHTDSDREWSYDRDSKVGRLDRALTDAPRFGWTVVDMKSDWKVVYPFESR